MLVYILDPMTLEKTDVLDDFESLVWTERFVDPGDVKIVMGATHNNAARLRPGNMLLHEDSNEPMLLDTRDIKQGVITAAGKTIEAFFNERTVGPLGRDGLASNIIRYVVYNMQNRQDGRYAFPNLRPQDFVPDDNTVGNSEHILGFEAGHDAVLRLAKKYSLGIAVIRQHNPTTGQLELVFVVRETKDRTQPGDDYARFSPHDDTFTGIDELYSLQDWVDVILVHAPHPFAKSTTDIAYGWAPMSYPSKTAHGGPNDFHLTAADNPFAWRIKEITADDIDQNYIDKRITDYWSPDLGMPATWSAMTNAQKETVLRGEMTARAQDEWRKRQTTQKVAFDGQVPGEILKFGRDYRLGDLVVVEGNFTGGKQAALVSEYIRASDGSGARSYPTLTSPSDVNVPVTVARPTDRGDYTPPATLPRPSTIALNQDSGLVYEPYSPYIGQDSSVTMAFTADHVAVVAGPLVPTNQAHSTYHLPNALIRGDFTIKVRVYFSADTPDWEPEFYFGVRDADLTKRTYVVNNYMMGSSAPYETDIEPYLWLDDVQQSVGGAAYIAVSSTALIKDALVTLKRVGDVFTFGAEALDGTVLGEITSNSFPTFPTDVLPVFFFENAVNIDVEMGVLWMTVE